MQVSCGKRARVMAVAAVALLQGVASCGGGGGGDLTPPTPVVTQLALSPGSATIVTGQTTTLTAQPKDAAGNAVNGLAVGWSVNDPTVATVALGVVTAIKAGQATITATSGSVSNTATITVIPAVASVTVTPTPSTLNVGQTATLTATLLDAGGATITGRTVAWTSSNDAFASVATTGATTALVTAKALGSVTITASVEGKSGTAIVDVKQPAVATVTVTPTTLTVGASKSLQYKLTDASGQTLTGRTVTWTSNAESKVTVDASGVVKGIAVGSATITATSEGKSGSATVDVFAAGAPTLTALTVSPTTVDVRAGAQTVTVSGQASDGSGTGIRKVEVTAMGTTRSTTHGNPTSACAAPATGGTIPTSGAWSCTLTIPRGAAAGQWPIVSVVITDNSAQVTTYTATQIAAAYNAKFTVTSDEDVTEASGPANITVSPTVVDVSTADQKVVVAADYTDDLSGVASFVFRLAPLSGLGASYECSGLLISGTPTNGRWGCSVTIPKGATPGFYSETFIALDGAFNKSQHTIAANVRVDRTP